MANRLASEKSPYLRQHSENPVDWYPWGPEALGRARAEELPLLVSIGYSACHWCHVMERESFEDPETAALMNRHFVCVKVDREERPDLDDVYQHAIQLLGRHGGWPLTAFLTPAGVPFFGGTYFPPHDRPGMPSFRRILTAVAEAFQGRRAEVESTGREILSALRGLVEVPTTPGLPSPKGWATAVDRLLARVDHEHGGFGSRPKFPNPMGLDVLWRAALLDGHAAARAAFLQALTAMADGGIHDQLGGGFHRYSTDERWAVPHFEKMLYDNALLAPLYLAAFQETQEPRFGEVAKDLFGYLAREMTSPDGGFYCTQDADSEGEEGRFFVWTPAEIAQLLGDAPRAEALCRQLGVSFPGNFEGTAASVPSRRGPATPELEADRRRLFEAREARPRPFRDEKILAGWNGLAISALVRGAEVLGDPTLLERARAAATFVATRMVDPQGSLLRAHLDGPGSVRAFAEDHAFLAVARLDLHAALGLAEDLARARAHADELLERFYVPELATVAVAAADAEPLVYRPLALYDSASPSATSAALEAFQRLGWLTGEARYRDAAQAIVRRHVEAMVENPFGFGNLLCGLDRELRGPVELIIVGAAADPGTQALLAAAATVHLPNRLLLRIEPGRPPEGIDPALWQGREGAAVPTAYVCKAGSCLAPLTDPAQLPAALRAARAG